MGQINTNNYPTVSSLADADLLIVENAVHGTGTTTPKQLRENAIGTDALKTTAQTVTGAINEVWETAGALRGSGKVTSGSSSTIDTDIDLGREPQVGDRILLLVDSKITAPISVTTYNGSTAITTYWGMLDPSLYLNGVCILEFEQGLDPDTCTVKLVKIFEGTIYTAGTGISLSGDEITNTKPQWGDNIVGQSLSSVSSGNLGIYEAHSCYLIITFDCNAQPASDGYWLSLQDNSGSVVIMKAAVLVDPVTGGRYSRNIKKYTTLICEVTNSGSGSSSDPVLVNVIGEITNDLADKVDAVLDAISEEKTVSGNPIVITDALALPAKSLKTTIEAIQDLHGYDKPWAGGAGKNKWSLGDISVDTQTNVPYSLPADTYTVSCNLDSTITLAIRFKYANDDSVLVAGINSNNPKTFTLTADCIKVNTTITGFVEGTVVTQMQIESGSSATSYAPYSNICPISGRTEARVDDTGKNQLPMTVSGIKAANTSGTWNGNVYTLNNTTVEILVDNDGNVNGFDVSASGATANTFFSLAPNAVFNGTYTLTGCPTGGSSSTYRMEARKVGTGDVYMYETGDGQTVSLNNVDLYGCIRIGNGASFSHKVFYPMIRFATVSDATFEPYVNNYATIQLGQTVYGADVNWDTGVMTVTHAITTLTGAESEAWDMSSGDGWHQFYLNILDSLSSADSISNRFEPIQLSDRGTKTGLIQYTDRTFRFALVDSQINITSVADWKTWLASNNVQVCYELATPTTIQLTPAQLQLLKGYNRLTIEDGTITLTYLANKLDAVLAALAAL